MSDKLTLKAKVKKHQTNINKALYYGVRYNEANNLRDKASDVDDTKAYNKFDRQCEVIFDKYINYLNELPKYEQTRVEALIFPN